LDPTDDKPNALRGECMSERALKGPIGASDISPWRDALERMLKRIEATAGTIDHGFPHYAETGTGTWTVSEAGDWTGGFWVGMLWLAHRVTGDPRYHDWARRWTQLLRRRASSETVFRGFLFYYGTALGDVLCGDDLARSVGIDGARGLATLFNTAAGIIPLGAAAEEATDVGASEANIDGMQSSALLAWAAERCGDARLRDIGARHALTSLKVFLRPDHSVVQSSSIDAATGRVLRTYTHKGIRDDSTWTRAQAWALLGTTVDAIWLPELRRTLLPAARDIADWWLQHVPADFVANWDFDAPRASSTPRDTSGTAIAAAALLKLSAQCDNEADRIRYRRAAESTASALISHFLTPTHAGDTRPVGMLTEGCYNYRISLATSHELIWGSYYLFEALCVLGGLLEPARI
jgi:unsaturated chondroitin disaccharide hydrolase